MIRKTLLSIILASSLIACKPSLKYYEAGDRQLTVQLINAEKESGAGNYRVRIATAGSLARELSYADKAAMLYRADSCFYLESNGKKLYPALAQSVANGLEGTFEYLVAFEPTESASLKQRAFVYKDPFLTRKAYAIKITE